MRGPMSGPTGQVVEFGDRALLVETDDVGAAHELADALADRMADGDAPGGIDDVAVGFASVVVILDPDPELADQDAVASWLARVTEGARSGGRRRRSGRRRRTHILPVVFDGPDLDEVAAAVGNPVHRVVDLVVAADLEVSFVGFAPGFPYLTGLPGPLADLPRRPTPRTSVPAGSLAVAAGFAAVYPRSTPGGWHLLGRTAVTLFDPDVPPHSRMAPGDHVRITVVGPDDVPLAVDDIERPALDAGDGPCLEVLEAGLMTTVQDNGRRGCTHLGVPAAGAADPRSLTLVNLLLGNRPGGAALECTASGPTLRVGGDGYLAAVGVAPGSVEVTVDGHPVPDCTVLPVTDGQVVCIGRVRRGLRAYLGVTGGLTTPTLFGSRSSDSLAGLGPGPLRVGDRLGRGPGGRPRGRLAPPAAAAPDGTATLRVLRGPHGSPSPGLTTTRWQVGRDIDRIGVRLEPVERSRLDTGGPRASLPMVTGAVQVPPDGRPIILLPDHATVGGYPVVACVVAADLALLGQLAPGDAVHFVEVDRSTAARSAGAERGDRAARVTGWFPTVAGT
jgi:KipI family sensor histidine kinase inhibitor